MKRYFKLSLSVVFILFIAGLFQILYGQPEIDWTRTFGGSGDDEGIDVQQTTDGGYIILGLTESLSSGSEDGWLIKTDANGGIIWSRTFGDDEISWNSSIQQTTDGGYIIVGNKLVKTDALGNTVWTNDDISGTTIQQTIDDGYVILGSIEMDSLGRRVDILLINLDSNGDTIWTNTIEVDGYGWAKSIQQTTDGGYIITGEIYQNIDGDHDVWLIKVDAGGDTTWTKSYGESGYDRGVSVQQTKDGGYVVAASGDWDHMCFAEGVLIKTDSIGEIQWMKTDTTYGYSALLETEEGGFVILGYHYEECLDIRLIRTDSNGDFTWTKNIEGSGWCSSLRRTTESGYIITGRINPPGDGDDSDVWLIKVGTDLIISNEILHEENARIFPNPAGDILNLHIASPGNHSIRIVSIDGQEIFSTKMEGNLCQINLSPYPSGIYFINIRSKDLISTKKIIKL